MELDRNWEGYDLARKLLGTASDYWDALRFTNAHGAVIYLKSEDGAMVVFTRGDCADELQRFVESLPFSAGCQQITGKELAMQHFMEDQVLLSKLRELAQNAMYGWCWWALDYTGLDIDEERQQDINADFVSAANPTAILALLDELDSYRDDAERYRWWRQNAQSYRGGDFDSKHDAIDAAIDLAMAHRVEE